MGKVSLLDCTLRDGGYVNDWYFGENTIKGFCQKIARTGIEIFEVGFLKGETYHPDRTLFPDTDSFTQAILPKTNGMKYVGMLDMSDPIPLERIMPRRADSIDGIRVIFKKDKIEQAFKYCQFIKELGYILFVNFVGTDLYTDKEFIEGIEKFNVLHPYAMSIVDTFGLIKRKQFMRLAYLADNNMADGIALCYHAHNNLQQAFGNAEALVEMNLKRDICIDACVFGMGRGAGNLNLELFADFMNENYNTQYLIEPMLEIMDEYLNDIYKSKFWGYSLPFYLSATVGCHPNYAIYLERKDSLTVKSFHELLVSISDEDKILFRKDTAEKYYCNFQESYIDDKETLAKLSLAFDGKKVLLIAPGKSLSNYQDRLLKAANCPDTIIFTVNFSGGSITPDYIFSSNMKRYRKIQGTTSATCITTSNMKGCTCDYVVNFSSYALNRPEIIDNSGLMALKLLRTLGVKSVSIAGMDGYSAHYESDYFDQQLDYDFSAEAEIRNNLISEEIQRLKKTLDIQFITPTQYETTYAD